MRRQTPVFGRTDAETLAIEAVSFLAEEPRRLARFLDLTGIDPASIRSAASDPNFLGAVLEHVAGYEPLLLEFAAHSGRDPADVAKAQAKLGGGTWERDIP